MTETIIQPSEAESGTVPPQSEENQIVDPTSGGSSQKVFITRNLDNGSPNVSLNTHGQSTTCELVFAAIFGATLQLGVLVYVGFATYHPSFNLTKGDEPVADYAYPCTLSGTLFLVFDLALSAHVVESSTKERNFISRDDKKTRVIDIVSFLSENSSRNLRDHFGRTSFYQAAVAGHQNIFGPLGRSGIFLDARDRNGQTALSIAAKNGHVV
ncbi:hypothetical protein BDP55DRAFT_712730 [Colletotrichum godetiae]|uniref:Ankyrin repeat protein n=1 Tax=Colletotrichum godetiae TaxID=1209918 RepID=A0AAJ0EKJ7_9PEZI|nr:uncharacterized protein BDP55DRAFT_639558 [Colletotrichum godetiae]XP_060433350.1 uncharacterized protein BDP55DRAFT_712730 [Colletotrichum godetiae]KAK1656520.1 hypothetical protein BDP55DRAFT_639558 [Colletotrichum godetiae]KAK1689655.1 hypothetical protein BDP55DRAFT_712730 [Colletotrichum godetiae]